MQNLKMERKNEELHAEKEEGKVSHLNITEFGASIWLSQHGSGLQRSDLETINHKKPLNGTRSVLESRSSLHPAVQVLL